MTLCWFFDCQYKQCEYGYDTTHYQYWRSPPDALVNNKCKWTESWSQIYPKRKNALRSAQCLGLPKVRIDEAITEWVKCWCKNCENDAYKEDFDEGMREISTGDRKVPHKSTAEEKPLSW